MVLNKIIVLLSEIVGIDENDITGETPLTRDYGVEPIDLAGLIIASEKKFNITIHDEYVSGFKNIKDIALYIEAELNTR